MDCYFLTVGVMPKLDGRAAHVHRDNHNQLPIVPCSSCMLRAERFTKTWPLGARFQYLKSTFQMTADGMTRSAEDLL